MLAGAATATLLASGLTADGTVTSEPESMQAQALKGPRGAATFPSPEEEPVPSGKESVAAGG